MLTITNIGLNAIARADEGGFLINLTSFKVGESTPADDKINAVSMVGAPVYEAKIYEIEAIGDASVQLTLMIPVGIPAKGVNWSLKEVGIYLDTGELFAYGALEPAYDKTYQYAIKVYAIITAARLGEVINITVSNNVSLPSTPHVCTLLKPMLAEQNTIVVLDEMENDYQDSDSASLAIKSGQGGLQWSFINYNRIYRGKVDFVVNSKSFKAFPETGGWWLNDGEICICQVVSGVGAGESRKVRFNKGSNVFTSIDRSFIGMDDQSIVSIWRNLKETLPTRYPTYPEYYMLGIGENSWIQNLPNTDVKKYVAAQITATLDIQGGVTSSELVDCRSECTYVWYNGELVDRTRVIASGNRIQVNDSSLMGKDVNILTFLPVDSETGGLVYKYEVPYKGDGVTSRFNFSIVPEDENWVVVLVDGKFVSNYTFEPTSILFDNAPIVNSDIRIILFATYEQPGVTEVYRKSKQVSKQISSIGVSCTIYQKKDVLLYLGGNFLPDEAYEVELNSISISEEYLTDSLQQLDITIFTSVELNQDPTVEGLDTGPVWCDPAGAVGPPNKIIPVKKYYVSDGSKISFDIPKVVGKQNIFMMVSGSFYNREEWEYDGQNTVTLKNPVPWGLEIDLMCFTEIKAPGNNVSWIVTTFTTQAGVVEYNLNETANNEDELIVVMGGAYQHKGRYSVEGNKIVFDFVIPGKIVEVMQMKQTQYLGHRTDIYINSFTDTDAAYPLDEALPELNNTIVTYNMVYQNKLSYNFAPHSSGTPLLNIQSLNLGEVIDCIMFKSEVPRTRLVLRTELNSLIRAEILRMLARGDFQSLLN